MNGTIDVFTLVALIAAIVVILKLRSVLGRRTGDDDARIERRAREQEYRERTAAAPVSDNVVALPKREADQLSDVERQRLPTEEMSQRIRKAAHDDSRLADGLHKVLKADPDFDPEHFLSGAQQAYEMIVVAFGEGNLRTLRDLLSEDVYRSFASAISEREEQGVQLDQTFIGINKAVLLEADVEKGSANIAVRFESQLITVTRDKSGKVISGDSGQIDDVTDIWTFARDVSSEGARANPNWKLVATETPN